MGKTHEFKLKLGDDEWDASVTIADDGESLSLHCETRQTIQDEIQELLLFLVIAGQI